MSQNLGVKIQNCVLVKLQQGATEIDQSNLNRWVATVQSHKLMLSMSNVILLEYFSSLRTTLDSSVFDDEDLFPCIHFRTDKLNSPIEEIFSYCLLGVTASVCNQSVQRRFSLNLAQQFVCVLTVSPKYNPHLQMSQNSSFPNRSSICQTSTIKVCNFLKLQPIKTCHVRAAFNVCAEFMRTALSWEAQTTSKCLQAANLTISIFILLIIPACDVFSFTWFISNFSFPF